MKALQIIRLILAALCLFLIVRWLSVPGWDAGKILGIIIMVLACAAAIISFIQARNKKKDDNDV